MESRTRLDVAGSSERRQDQVPVAANTAETASRGHGISAHGISAHGSDVTALFQEIALLKQEILRGFQGGEPPVEAGDRST